MPNSKDSLMMQAVFAFAQGCGTAEIDDAACEWFHGRYYGWIDRKKDHPRAKGSPQQVWNEYGKAFLGRFKLIGQRAAAKGGPIQADTLKAAATSVELESDCPYCP
jgi:hypothetical protein